MKKMAAIGVMSLNKADLHSFPQKCLLTLSMFKDFIDA